MYVKILDTEFYLDEGQVIKDNYNETLDSAVLRIDKIKAENGDSVTISESIDFEPFDMVYFYYDNGDLYKIMCIDKPDETQVCANPRIYSYEIDTFSLIKEFEGFICPNLSIKQRWSTNLRTIGFYLSEYLKQYGPKIRTTNGFVNKYEFDTETLNYFNTIECPEMQWNQPTLREVFNDLMMVKDCIPYIDKDLKIKHLNLTLKRNNVTNSPYINLVKKSRDSVDYVSDLRMNLVNVMQNTNTNIKNYVSKVEWLPFNTKTDLLMNSDNIILKTKYPILRIKHLYMYVYGIPWVYNGVTQPSSDNRYGGTFIKMDLTQAKTYNDTETYNMVYEEDEWKTKQIVYKLSDIPDSSWAPAGSGITNPYNVFKTFENLSKYQNTTLHYKRGDNIIDGFNQLITEKFVLFNWDTQNLQIYLNSITKGSNAITIQQQFPEFDNEIVLGIDTGSSLDYLYQHIFFQIEYETMAETLFTAGKSDTLRHKRTIIDNQTNSYVNPDVQGDLEYNKANRLGNPIRFINAVYPIGVELMKIGDYYDDSIIYYVEYQFYKTHVNVNAYGTKDYILKNYFTGVKARIRSWKITDGLDALARHNLKKIYCEFDYSAHSESTQVIDPDYLLTTFTTTDVKPLNLCGVQSYFAERFRPVRFGIIPPEIIPTWIPQYCLNDFSMRLIGDSIVLTTGFEDNYTMAQMISRNDISVNVSSGLPSISNNLNLGGVPMTLERYVDENGECTQQKYTFATTLLGSDTRGQHSIENIETGTRLPIYSSTHDNATKQFFYDVYTMPIIDTEALDDVKFQFTTDYVKDNNEILVQSVQFEFCSNTHDIVFTKKFLEKQEMIRVLSNNTNFKIYIASSDSYNFKDPKVPSNYYESHNINIGSDNGWVIMGFNRLGPIDLSDKTIYIVDGNDELIMALNRVPASNYFMLYDTMHVTFFLNILFDRDKNIYNLDLEPIGSI